MASSVRTSKMQVKSDVIIGKSEEPEKEENIVYSGDNQTTERKGLTEDERKYIVDLIERGYHHKDIMKKSNAYLKADKSILKALFTNVRRSSDIIMNMEKL